MYSNLNSCTVKYIDDASQARSINLHKALTPIQTQNMPRPLEFSQHTGFIVNESENHLQNDLNELKQFTDRNLMIINEKKTLIMKFNFHKSLDFPAIYNFQGGRMLDVVNQTKILGLILSDTLNWSAQVDYMIRRANKKIWLLRKMKTLKLNTEILVDFYCKEIRSILEYGVAIWHSGLTQKMIGQLERVQKICVSIILCDTGGTVSYKVGCTILNLEPLVYRRHDLCVRFIQRASINPKHSDLFVRNIQNINTRSNKLFYKEYKCRTKRFYDSPLCYLTRLLNSNPIKLQ